MKITNRTSLLGFILFLSALEAPNALASSNHSPQTIDNRISALTEILKQKETQAVDITPNMEDTLAEDLLSWGNWRNGGGGAGWRNGGGGGVGWRNSGGGGTFANVNRPFSNWPNAWRDGGGFANFRNW